MSSPAQYRANTVLVLRIQLQKRHQAELIYQVAHCTVELGERITAHYFIGIGGIAIVYSLFVFIQQSALRRILQQTDIRLDVLFQLFPRYLSFHQIHLAEDVDVGKLKHQHRTHGTQGAGEELGSVDDESALEQVGCAHAYIQASAVQRLYEIGDDRHVGIQLDLTGHVDKDEILLRDILQRLGQEVHVFQEELKAVYQAAIRAEVELFHDIFEGDELSDKHERLLLRRCWIKAEQKVVLPAPAGPMMMVPYLEPILASGFNTFPSRPSLPAAASKSKLLRLTRAADPVLRKRHTMKCLYVARFTCPASCWAAWVLPMCPGHLTTLRGTKKLSDNFGSGSTQAVLDMPSALLYHVSPGVA
ncbi:GPN-loop GTPase [Hortaea werneckii]|nr:GPN-loop GTPase [Hortaea werneckii]